MFLTPLSGSFTSFRKILELEERDIEDHLVQELANCSPTGDLDVAYFVLQRAKNDFYVFKGF